MRGLGLLLVLSSFSVSFSQASRALLQDIEDGPARPPYDVINKTEGYELRKYDNGNSRTSLFNFQVCMPRVKCPSDCFGLAIDSTYLLQGNIEQRCLDVIAVLSDCYSICQYLHLAAPSSLNA